MYWDQIHIPQHHVEKINTLSNWDIKTESKPISH